MSLANTTLASACGASDTVIVVAASTNLSARDKVEIDGEIMQIVQTYTTAGNGVNVPVLRGQNGTYAYAHPSGAKVRSGPASDTDWGAQAPQTLTQYPIATPARQRTSYTASGAITLPNPGNDMVAFLNGTSVLAMTVADPKTAADGSFLWIVSNGIAAHTITFATGLSGTGASGSYDVITVNASGPVALGPFIASGGFWNAAVAVPMAGTVTNITATVA
jgi:hypothetical protein